MTERGWEALEFPRRSQQCLNLCSVCNQVSIWTMIWTTLHFYFIALYSYCNDEQRLVGSVLFLLKELKEKHFYISESSSTRCLPLWLDILISWDAWLSLCAFTWSWQVEALSNYTVRSHNFSPPQTEMVWPAEVNRH